MITRRLTGKKGAIMLLTVIMLSFLTLFGVLLISLVSTRLERVTLEIERTRAFCLAEAGISRSFREIKAETDLDGNGSVGGISQTALGGGFYVVSHNMAAQTILSTGIINNISRKIEVIYEK